MNSRGWKEEREVRVMQTGDGHVIANKGDYVFVVIVKRWEDVNAELGRLARLTDPKATEP